MVELTVKEYAERMKCSSQTVMRRIKEKQVKARKIKENNIEKWVIVIPEVTSYEVETLPVSRPLSPMELKELIVGAVTTMTEALQGEVQALNEQTKQQGEHIEALRGEIVDLKMALAERDIMLTEIIRDLQSTQLSRVERRKSWWQRIFG